VPHKEYHLSLGRGGREAPGEGFLGRQRKFFKPANYPTNPCIALCMKLSTHRARELRQRSTPPEKMFWQRVRNRQLAGLKIRRQVPVGAYLVDFLCEEQKLIVELDGDTHAHQIEYDQRRDAFLVAAGYRVVRVTNADIFVNIDGVLIRILDICRG